MQTVVVRRSRLPATSMILGHSRRKQAQDSGLQFLRTILKSAVLRLLKLASWLMGSVGILGTRADEDAQSMTKRPSLKGISAHQLASSFGQAATHTMQTI